MDRLTLFGLFAVTLMLVCYALEDRSRWFVLTFAVACALGSIYGFLQGPWPFGLVEAVWAVVALRRWSVRRSANAYPASIAGGSLESGPRQRRPRQSPITSTSTPCGRTADLSIFSRPNFPSFSRRWRERWMPTSSSRRLRAVRWAHCRVRYCRWRRRASRSISSGTGCLRRSI